MNADEATGAGRQAPASLFNVDWHRGIRGPVFLTLLVVWSSLMSAGAVFLGILHDYIAYLDQWAVVRDGGDPWSGSNTYGPLHNLLAYLAIPSELGPKVFMAVLFVAVNFFLAAMLVSIRPTNTSLAAYAVFVPMNFLVFGIVFAYGLNDGLAAALIGLALILRFRERLVLCGVFLGLAVLLKYYPALLIPFFSLDDRRFDPRLLLSSAITIATGLIATWLAWGTAFLAALWTGASREPKLLSILSALERNDTFGASSSLLDWLIRLNALAVVAACGLALVVAYRMRLTWIEGAAVGALAYLLVYKVGHQQFYIPWLLLLVGLLVLATRRSKMMAYVCVPYVMFLSLFQFGYSVLTDGYNSIGGVVRDNVGFVAFALGSITLLLMGVIGGWATRPQERPAEML